MVAANFILSAAAQYEKAKPDVWGAAPAIDVGRPDKGREKPFYRATPTSSGYRSGGAISKVPSGIASRLD